MFDLRNLNIDMKADILDMLFKEDSRFEGALHSYTFVTQMVAKIFYRCGVDDKYKKINCIKAVRCCLSIGLRESKEYVERFQDQMPTKIDLVTLVKELNDYLDDGNNFVDKATVQTHLNNYTDYRSSIDIVRLQEAIVEDIIDNARIEAASDSIIDFTEVNPFGEP